MVETRVWYPCNVLMLTLFWMTSAVIGIRGRTSMCRMNSFWPLWVCEFCHLELKVWAAAGTWEWLGWSCTSQPSTLCSTSPEEKNTVKPLGFWHIWGICTDWSDIGHRLVRGWCQRGCWENAPSWNGSPPFLCLFHQRFEAGGGNHDGLFLELRHGASAKTFL